MSLVFSLRSSCKPARKDFTRYADLLLADDQKNLDELKRLMIILRKNADDVKADQVTVKTVNQLEAAIEVGKNTTPQVDSLWSDIQAHEAETRRITNERKQTIQHAYDERAMLLNNRQAAIEAIATLGTLKDQNPDLLVDLSIPAVTEIK